MEWLNHIDTECFYWINHHHSTFTDWLMWIASQSWSWVIVILCIFVLLTLRQEPRRWWIVALGIAFCFLLSDRISVLCFKNVVCRLRPCHALEDVRMFRTTCGGLYGFISSHAANVFSLAMFFSLRYSHGKFKHAFLNRHSQVIVPLVLFMWALLVGYSRPYLGKHYPGDVLCGAIVGIALGAFVYFVIRKLELFLECRKKSGK